MSRRIFVSGGRGLVGRNLLDRLSGGDDIVSSPTRSELDLADADALRRHLSDFRPDVIIHAAGKVGGIQANIDSPVSFLVDNTDLGRNILLAGREVGTPVILNLASSCIYPKDHPTSLSEDLILTGAPEPTNEGYAIAKIFTLRLGQYINRQDGRTTIKTLIPCNLYGPYDHFDAERAHLVPAIIRKMHAAKVEGLDEVEIWGDGSARREFMFAPDLADAIVRAVDEFETLPEIMNVGLGDDHTVLDYYRTAAEVIGWTGNFRFDLSRPVGMKRKLVDVSKQTRWGWEAKTTLADGISATYEYFRRTVRP